MGRADSPLLNRVVFIEGAPRSGTTWLVTLLASHSRIAGVENESHLFDAGIDRAFDNFDGKTQNRGLRGYVDRAQLADLARDFCDGAFLAMRDSLRTATAPEYVVEKTPLGARGDGLELERKREVYPDAWYLHIVRDREAVIRSLMRAPFMSDRSYERCAALWDHAVGTIRDGVGDHERYLEVDYDELRADPVDGCRRLLERIGVPTADHDLERIRALTRERFSDLGAVPGPAASPARSARAVAGRLRAWARRGRPALATGGAVDAFAFSLVSALRGRDAGALAALCHPKLEYALRGPDGDELLDGEEAVAALTGLARMFERRYVGEWWASAGTGPAEWWTSAPGRPFCSVFFAATSGDATRVDVALGITLEDGLMRRVTVVAAGPLAGRPAVAGG